MIICTFLGKFVKYLACKARNTFSSNIFVFIVAILIYSADLFDLRGQISAAVRFDL